MEHKIHDRFADMLVMIDYRSTLRWLKLLLSRTALTALNRFYIRWIYIFVTPTYALNGRGSNLAAEPMKEKLHGAESWLYPISIQTAWRVGLNERPHWYSHKSIHHLQLQKSYDTGHAHEVLLMDIKVDWNFAQHTSNILSHYNCSWIMSRVNGSIDKSSYLMEHIAIMHPAREETNNPRARDFISSALDKNRQAIAPMTSFAVQEKFCFIFIDTNGAVVRLPHLTHPLSWQGPKESFILRIIREFVHTLVIFQSLFLSEMISCFLTAPTQRQCKSLTAGHRSLR